MIWLLLQASERPKEKPLCRGRTGDYAEADATRPRSAPGGRIDGNEEGNGWSYVELCV